MIKKIGERQYKIKITTDTNILKIVLPIGSMTEYIPVGYAHFIEHLIIRNNYEMFFAIEKAGGWYNATTKEYDTEFLIYDIPNNIFKQLFDDGFIANLFKIKLSHDDIENEKNTILNEYKLLVANNDQQFVANSVGDEQEIMNFNLKQVETILSENNQVWLYYYANFDEQFDSLVMDNDEPLIDNKLQITTDADKVIISFSNENDRQKTILLLELLKVSEISLENFTMTKQSLAIPKDEYELLVKNISNIKKRFDILMNLNFSKYNSFITGVISEIAELQTLSARDLEQAWNSCYDT